MKKRLFFDQDGVLAKHGFDPTKPYLHKFREKGYYLNLPEHENITSAVHKLYATRSDDYEQFMISAVYRDARYALSEKHDWADLKIPEIDVKHRIFILCGDNKFAYVPGFDPSTDILIDDFGENCRAWRNAGGFYIKVSADAEDAKVEAKKHRYVIHPGMSTEDIIKVIDKVSSDLDEFCENEYDIECIETYSEVYRGIKGKTYADAVERLDALIRDHYFDGPRYCVFSEYIDRTRKEDLDD